MERHTSIKGEDGYIPMFGKNGYIVDFPGEELLWIFV